jgi:hypothetical protein
MKISSSRKPNNRSNRIGTSMFKRQNRQCSRRKIATTRSGSNRIEIDNYDTKDGNPAADLLLNFYRGCADNIITTGSTMNEIAVTQSTQIYDPSRGARTKAEIWPQQQQNPGAKVFSHINVAEI